MRPRAASSYGISGVACSCFASAPVFWEHVDLTLPYQLVSLAKHTREYQTVANYVQHEGMLGKSIVSIRRIQNMDLWELYCRKTQQLMRIHRVTKVQERRLFHGTESGNIDGICKYNFDMRLVGRRHGHAYGKGIYFAKFASQAAKYSKRSPGDCGHGELLMARVLIGRPTLGAKEKLKPDHGALETTHDSCVDNIANPRVYVIFDSNQIYPEYLIEYRV
uniref:poly [ADP-ribose] polymerase 11-like n=1 Tax=Monopterus albus TaxID=43700 RepID=UPI0009B36880|nr:poly [ADP-ribose] polymerase 11-like [Monopterus albus]